ncbi:hypothetical protein E2C01_063255 [Portunus trituberculatus]|uniref:Uncharacterized protein n=1 Tax=Portunus trituberculatus TaxID=210409 RepID=A0A5B7HD73_PORTR|nr:hypothetical protein [Portunus trituberculatus]
MGRRQLFQIVQGVYELLFVGCVEAMHDWPLTAAITFVSLLQSHKPKTTTCCVALAVAWKVTRQEMLPTVSAASSRSQKQETLAGVLSAALGAGVVSSCWGWQTRQWAAIGR